MPDRASNERGVIERGVIERWSREMDARGPAGENPLDGFLRMACLSYTEPDAAGRAADLLAEDPALATATAGTLAACAEADLLAELLDRDRAAVSRETGPHRWPPLLYLCYSRLGVGDPVATMRVLLAAGADPNAGFLWRGQPSPFTAVTGVLGGGERDEPPHPDAVPLAGLLLDAGADPNDNQAFYNRQFRADNDHLPPLLGHGAGRPAPSPWRDRLGASYPSPEEMVGEHLRSAAAHGFTERVRILLEHGVDPNTRGYHPVLGDQTAYEVAVRNGHPEAAALLEQAGGWSDRLDEVDRAIGAAFAGGRAEGAPGGHPADLVDRRPDAMRLAAEQHDRGALERLLALGFDVNAAAADRRTALHEAALRGDRAMVTWLIEHGADPTLRDRDFGATPAGWAAYAGHQELAAWLEAGASPP